jgi:hypothetical protein
VTDSPLVYAIITETLSLLCGPLRISAASRSNGH